MTWTPTRYDVYQKYRVLSYRKLERAIAKARSLTKYSPNGVPVWAWGPKGHPFWYYIPAYCIVFGDGTIQFTLLATEPTDTATATDTDTATEASV